MSTPRPVGVVQRPELRPVAPARSLALVVAAVLAAAAPAARSQVADHTGPDLAPNIVIPQLRVLPIGVPDSPATLASVEASVTIHDQAATTELRLVVRNSSGRVQEAQLLVPIPDGCTIGRFELEGLGEQGIAKILPRDEARRIYNSIVNATRDPALLEFVGSSLVRSSIFPVPPGGEQAVRVTFDQMLPADGQRVDYVLPRSQSMSSSGVAWSFRAEVRSARPVSTVYSPTHELKTRRVAPGHVEVTADTASAPGPVRLSYLVEQAAGAPTPTLIAYPDPSVGSGQGGYFLLLAGLPADRPEGLAPVKREVMLVLDRSGSMRDRKIDQAREAARQVLEGLRDGEAFNIIDYSDTVSMLSDRPLVKSAETMARARAYLDAITANGGTNIHDALVEALRQPVTDGSLPMVLFLTDGLPTVGVRSETAIKLAAAKANLFNRRVFAFGVGYDVNTPLLAGLSDATRASATFVQPDEDVEVKVGQVFRRLSGPVIATPVLTALEGGSAVRDVLPGRLPDYFEGDQVLVLGQYTGPGPLKLRLTGGVYGRPREFTYTFDLGQASTRNAFVPRLWAGRRIATLIDQVRQSGGDASSAMADPAMQELVDEVVRLSTRWGILTEYTSFLAADQEELQRLATLGVTLETIRGQGGQVVLDNAAPEAAARMLSMRAIEARTGADSMNQDVNLITQKDAASTADYFRYLDGRMNTVRVTRVQHVADRTLFFRGGRWIDSAILDHEADEPDEVVEFGTKAYLDMVDLLASRGMQGTVSNIEDTYLLVDGRRVLVRGPQPKPQPESQPESQPEPDR